MKTNEISLIGRWEIYEAGPSVPRSLRFYVTINAKSVIHLNGNVHRAMGSPDFVMLMFDRLNSCIGIQPVTDGRPNAFPVMKKPKVGTKYISARPFCKHFGIQFKQTRAFTEAEIDEHGILRLGLDTTVLADRSAQYRVGRREPK